MFCSTLDAGALVPSPPNGDGGGPDTSAAQKRMKLYDRPFSGRTCDEIWKERTSPPVPNASGTSPAQPNPSAPCSGGRNSRRYRADACAAVIGRYAGAASAVMW
jgi:hypothetical protein